MAAFFGLFRQTFWVISAVVALWSVFLVLSTSSYFQTHFLYAHRVSPWWQDADQPQQWGFAKNQVTPFTLTTHDNETIYAWHVLPLPIYNAHERQLLEQPEGFCQDVTSARSFRLLAEDPTAKLIIFFHGNAGHVPNAIRAPAYHTMTDATRYHLIAIDYRGFGKSTGFPSEAGLISDAAAVVDFALQTAGVSPDRIVLLGQSLGTAVTSAVAERYARRGTDFAGVVLVAGFSSLPTMLSGYAIAGWVPLLRPLAAFPRVLDWVLDFVVDKWASVDRLASLVRAVKERDGHLRLSLVHAADDWDIPCHEDDKLFAAAVSYLAYVGSGAQTLAEMKAERTLVKGEKAFVVEWAEGDLTVRQELFPYGGHNNIMRYAPVISEVTRSFGDVVSVV